MYKSLSNWTNTQSSPVNTLLKLNSCATTLFATLDFSIFVASDSFHWSLLHDLEGWRHILKADNAENFVKFVQEFLSLKLWGSDKNMGGGRFVDFLACC